MFDKLLIDRPDFSLSDPVPISDQTAHEPDICLDPDGRPWVAWSGRTAAGDRIFVKPVEPSAPPLALSARAGVEFQPSVAFDSNGDLVCAWVALREDSWHLLTRRIHTGRPADEVTLADNPKGLFRPRLLCRQNVVWLVYESATERRSTIRFMKSEDGVWTAPQTLDCGPGDCFRPSITTGPDDAPLVSFDKYNNGQFEIILIRLNHLVNPISISKSFYRSVQPVLQAGDGRVIWVAWATNEGNEARDPWWLTKYVTLRRIDGERIEEPAETMPRRDLQNEDAFQGWEFPEISVDGHGRIWLFGQASHRLYAQYFGHGGWSERFTISKERWGSWKPRFRTAGAGPIYVASMGLDGAQVQRLDVHEPDRRVESDRYPTAPVTSEGVAPSVRTVERGGSDLERSRIAPGLNVYFGDLHGHSVYGDAVGDVDEFYFRYRDAYGYDFAALTEHDYLDGMQLSQSELAMMWASAERMTVDGRFVAFYAYEWTSPALADHAGKGGVVGEGHRHILYPDKSGPLLRYGDRSTDTAKELLARLAGRRALVIPHHTAWSGTDLEAYDPELSRLIEICSTHGRFEYPGNRPIGYRRDHVHPGKYVVDALARGQRLGFVGGSDSHGLLWHATEMEGRAAHIPPGTRVGWKEDAYRTGMTAILAPELTRAALFEALYERRCYATSGEPIFLDFRVNDAVMGSEITVTSQPKLTVSVRGTADLEAVEFIRQGFVFERFQFGGGERRPETTLDVVDELLIPGETQYYYARITQTDGNMAWSSPIWVTLR